MQASIGLTLGSRRRIIGSTLPHAEIEQLLDTIGQIPGVDLNDFDFSISCRIPGSRTYWSTLGLALCMCLVGSAQQRPVPPELMFLGEVDLLRRIRDLPGELTTEIMSGITAGALRRPLRIICSPTVASAIGSEGSVKIVPCRTVDEAVFATWPESR